RRDQGFPGGARARARRAAAARARALRSHREPARLAGVRAPREGGSAVAHRRPGRAVVSLTARRALWEYTSRDPVYGPTLEEEPPCRCNSAALYLLPSRHPRSRYRAARPSRAGWAAARST